MEWNSDDLFVKWVTRAYIIGVLIWGTYGLLFDTGGVMRKKYEI